MLLQYVVGFPVLLVHVSVCESWGNEGLVVVHVLLLLLLIPSYKYHLQVVLLLRVDICFVFPSQMDMLLYSARPSVDRK